MPGEKYDLTGIRGAENFRELEAGLLLELEDGAVVELTDNARDGVVVVGRVVRADRQPERVGEEAVVFYKDVRRVIEEEQEDE
jgi:hypothetical protein